MAVSHPRFHLLVLIGCGLCVAGPSRAQLPRGPLGATPAPLPPSPPAMPGAPNNTLPGATPFERPTVDVLWNNAEIVDILHEYEDLSGKHVLYDNTVQGRLTIDVKGVTRTDALRIIETALNLNKFALIPGDNNIVKCVGIGQPVRPVGVPIFADLADLPDTEEIVTFMLRLNYLDPAETAGVLGQYITPPNNSIGFTALKSANALLITDTARSVRRLVALVRDLDLPASPVTEKFIALQRADATKAVEFLNGVFETKATAGTPGGAPGAASAAGGASNTRRPIRRVGEDGQPVEVPGLATTAGGLTVLSGDSLVQGRITLTADIRTNRVHVVTSPVNMPLVERLLHEYDADTPFASPVRFPLRFIEAADVLPILVDALKEPGSDNGNGPSSGAGTPSPSRSSNSSGGSGSGFFGSSGTGSSTGSPYGGGLGGTSGAGGSGLGDDSNAPEVDTRPTEAVVGNNRIIADQANNNIILLGGEDARAKILAILNQLDVRSPQVIIRTVIGELTLDNNHELGFQYLLRTNRGSLLSQFNAGQLGTTSTTTAASTPTGTTTTGTSTLNTFNTLATGLGSSFTGVGGIVAIGKSLDLIVSALDSTDRFKTISRPMIVTSNNKRAFISSGTQIAIAENSLSSLTTAGTSTGISSTTTYIPVVLKLSVTPRINSEKEVTLDIKQEINSLSGTSNSINGSTAPNISTRELQNYVSARNGQTIVLGGLITQDDNLSSSDIPYLSKIPLLGNLFKAKTRDQTRNELIILMCPEVVNTASIMADVREKEENRTYLGHDLEDQLLPTIPVRKAIPVKTKTTTTTTSSYVPDDKLHPAARNASASPTPKRTTTTTTTTDTATVRPND